MGDLLTRINRWGVVNVPIGFWLIVAFEARYWILTAGAAVGVRRNRDTSRILGDGVPWMHLALELPVILLAFAAANREPGAWPWIRALWGRGRELLTLACALNAGWVAWYLMSVHHWKPMPDNLMLLAAIVDAMIALAAWTWRDLTQAFAEFPAPKPPQ